MADIKTVQLLVNSEQAQKRPYKKSPFRTYTQTQNETNCPQMSVCLVFGRKEATRTPDPYVPNVVRYQLRYFPIF